MNFRDRYESETEQHLRYTTEQWSKLVDNKWDFRLNVIRSIEHLLELPNASGSYTVRYGFLAAQRKICLAGPDSGREYIIIRCVGCDYTLIIQDWEFEYYEGIAKSLRQQSAKLSASVRFRVPSPTNGGHGVVVAR